MAHGIDQIIADIQDTDVHSVFSGVTKEETERPRGPIDLLARFEYTGYHPTRLHAVDHLLIIGK